MQYRHQSDVSSRRDFLKSVGVATAVAGVGALPKVGVADCKLEPPLTHLSAKKLAKLIADRHVSALEVAEAYLQRIEEVNPKLNAIVQMDAERIRAEARQADNDLSKGVTKGPLHGVPFTIKDCLLTKGIITTNGCPELRSYVPTEDATVVKRLKEAGGILIGKTNVPEMCFGDTDNLVYGPTNNPYRLEYSPGGSSGGEGAIIAAGGSPFGLGTDIGGSIRDPSHSCGIAGIKPTSRRVPETGILQTFPLAVGNWNAIGPMARHVEDLYLVLRIISGPDEFDPQTVPVSPVGNPNDVRIQGLRAVYFTDDGITAPTNETKRAVERAAQALEASGVSVANAYPPCVARAPALWLQAMIPSWSIAMRYWQREYARIGGSVVSDERLPFMEFLFKSLDLLYENGNHGPERYEEFQRALQDFRMQMLQFITDYDVLLSPVVSGPPGPHMSADDIAKIPVADFWNLATKAMGGFYLPHNLTGWPAVAVRGGTSPDGLPIGVQVAARPWREDLALAVAGVIEDKLDGWKPPDL